MKSYLYTPFHLLCVYVAVILTCGSNTAAQELDLGNLAKRLSHQIEKDKIHSVVVADFVSLNGTQSVEGHYLAQELSQRLEHYKKNFAVTDRNQLSSALANARISPNDLNSPEILQRIGASLQADAIVTGTLEISPARYLVRVSVHSVKDGSIVALVDQRVKRPAYVDSLVLLDPGGSATKVARAGVDGIGVPTCLACPPPDYTDKARKAKIQANVVLLVVIDQEGRAGKIAVTTATDDGLAVKAIEAVRKWRFKPATDREGKPVSVLVPIQVTFRLY